MNPHELLIDVMSRHGGHDRWQGVERIDVHFSTGGLAFASRGLGASPLRHVCARLSPHRFEAELSNFGADGIEGRVSSDHVRLLAREQTPLLERSNPRDRFSFLARQFRWDHGDLCYFAAYAMWNYVCFPFCLSLPDVQLLSASPWRRSGWRLDVHFPDSIPTHSRFQQFYFDARLQLVLHAYCADVIGRYARAIHRCYDYRESDGFALSRRRRVTPRVAGDVGLAAPTLVWIEIEGVHYQIANGGIIGQTNGRRSA
jgi:hypothetical protein